MPTKGYIWDDEYRDKYYSSPKVQVHLEAFLEQVKQPKSDATKKKMRDKKKDVPKTEDHKAAMSAAQKHRHAVRRELTKRFPDKTKAEIWALVKEVLKND